MVKRVEKQAIPDGVEAWPECDLCPKLCSGSTSVCMEGEGPSVSRLMVVNGNPSAFDDEMNRPFMDELGEYLRDTILVGAKIPESKVRFTHAVRCRTVKGKVPSVSEVKRCRRYLEAEIKLVQPKVIVAMGNAALASIMQSFYKGGAEEGTAKKQDSILSGIGKWRGKMVWLQEFNCWLMPTYHPSECVTKRGYSTYTTSLIVSDLKQAWLEAQKERPVFPLPKSVFITESSKAKSVLQKMKDSKSFAFDIETGGTGRSKDKWITGCSFSCSPDIGYYIKWNAIESSKEVFGLFKELMTGRDYYKVMHNGAYEVRILTMVYGIELNGVKYFDTMISVHLVDENFSKRLKDNAWLYTRFGGYDVPVEKYKQEHRIKEDYSKIPDEILSPYGAFDAIATWIAYTKLDALMVAEKVDGVFHKIAMPVRRVMSDAEINGMKVDVERAVELDGLCTTAIQHLEKAVYKCAGKEFNIGSPVQLQTVLYKDMGFVPLKETKGGYSADADSIAYVATQKNSSIAQHLLDLSYVHTMKGTHIGQAIAYTWPEDGRVHTNYNVTGAVTGRASCLVAGTMVPTNRGTLSIEEVLPGDFVVSHLGNVRKVVKVLDQGVSSAYKLTTKMFRDILCTSDHRFYTPNGWVEAQYVKEVFGVSIKSVDERFRVFESGGGLVCERQDEANLGRGCHIVGNHSTECLGGIEKDVAKREGESRGYTSLLSEQDGETESYDREVRGATPSVERSEVGWEGSSGFEGRRGALSLSSRDSCKDVGYAPIQLAEGGSGSSHRWESIEQHGEQSCCMHSGWPQESSPKVDSVTTFSYVGEVRVYDLVIDTDESFVANGFLVHNCSQPSIQNVPADQLVRSLYVASPGNVLVDGDLKSAEMATIAAVSGETTFLKAFSEGLDIHSETYRKMYNLPSTYVCSKLERRQAKAINFGLVYGMSPVGLAGSLGVTVEEASAFMDLYFKQLPNVAAWMEEQKRMVKQNGYVVSVFGRKRRLPLGFSDQWGDIGRAERQAMNSPIQSGAADYTYVGLIRLRQAILRDHLRGKIVHTVHDCVVVDTPEDESERMVATVGTAFQTRVAAMPVKMMVEVEVHQRWGQNNESRLQGIFDVYSLKLTA